MISRNGIAVDPVKWQETQRRANLKYAEKRRAAVVVSREGAKVRVRRSPIKKRAGVQPDFSPASRRSIRRRSGGRCELGLLVCLGEATQVHHRKLRRHGDHRTENGIHVCQECHASVHIATGLAYRNGWLVRSTQDPATVPVRLRGGRLVYLAADGFYAASATSDVAS